MGVYTCMLPFVWVEFWLSKEAFSTRLAEQLKVASVPSHVWQKVPPVSKLFLTMGTGKLAAIVTGQAGRARRRRMMRHRHVRQGSCRQVLSCDSWQAHAAVAGGGGGYRGGARECPGASSRLTENVVKGLVSWQEAGRLDGGVETGVAPIRRDVRERVSEAGGAKKNVRWNFTVTCMKRRISVDQNLDSFFGYLSKLWRKVILTKNGHFNLSKSVLKFSLFAPFCRYKKHIEVFEYFGFYQSFQECGLYVISPNTYAKITYFLSLTTLIPPRPECPQACPGQGSRGMVLRFWDWESISHVD